MSRSRFLIVCSISACVNIHEPCRRRSFVDDDTSEFHSTSDSSTILSCFCIRLLPTCIEQIPLRVFLAPPSPACIRSSNCITKAIEGHQYPTWSLMMGQSSCRFMLLSHSNSYSLYQVVCRPFGNDDEFVIPV
jgi:hypothetical protein